VVRRRFSHQVGKTAEKERAKNVNKVWKNVLKLIAKKFSVRCGLYSISSVLGVVVVFSEHDSELSGPVKVETFFV
jgi:hypothetical protein